MSIPLYGGTFPGVVKISSYGSYPTVSPITPADLGTGTKNNTTFHRGDNTWTNTLNGSITVAGRYNVGATITSVIVGRGQNASLSGSNNILMGISSGSNLTTGYGNVLLSTNAGQTMTTGSYNYIIGENAGSNNQSYNIAIGAASQQVGTSDHNISFGYFALNGSLGTSLS